MPILSLVHRDCIVVLSNAGLNGRGLLDNLDVIDWAMVVLLHADLESVDFFLGAAA